MKYLKPFLFSFPLIMILVLFSNESMSQTSKVSSENNIKTQNIDTPIKATGKTDPNYEINLAKSKSGQSTLNSPNQNNNNGQKCNCNLL